MTTSRFDDKGPRRFVGGLLGIFALCLLGAVGFSVVQSGAFSAVGARGPLDGFEFSAKGVRFQVERSVVSTFEDEKLLTADVVVTRATQRTSIDPVMMGSICGSLIGGLRVLEAEHDRADFFRTDLNLRQGETPVFERPFPVGVVEGACAVDLIDGLAYPRYAGSIRDFVLFHWFPEEDGGDVGGPIVEFLHRAEGSADLSAFDYALGCRAALHAIDAGLLVLPEGALTNQIQIRATARIGNSLINFRRSTQRAFTVAGDTCVALQSADEA